MLAFSEKSQRKPRGFLRDGAWPELNMNNNSNFCFPKPKRRKRSVRKRIDLSLPSELSQDHSSNVITVRKGRNGGKDLVRFVGRNELYEQAPRPRDATGRYQPRIPARNPYYDVLTPRGLKYVGQRSFIPVLPPIVGGNTPPFSPYRRTKRIISPVRTARPFLRGRRPSPRVYRFQRNRALSSGAQPRQELFAYAVNQLTNILSRLAGPLAMFFNYLSELEWPDEDFVLDYDYY